MTQLPGGLEAGAQRVVLDVLEPGQPVGHRAHVAATLDVVLAAQRVEATPVAADVSGQKCQVDEGEDVVDRVVVLRDSKRPADHGPWRRRIGMGEVADRGRRNAGLALGVLERVRLDTGPVGLEVRRRAVDELAVREAGGDDLATDGVRERDVGPDIDPEPDVGPLGRARPTRVDGVEPRPVADALQQVMEEDRVRLARVRTPQDDEVRVLSFSI